MSPTDDGAVPEHQPNCMVCGTQNPDGYGMRMRIVGDRVHGSVRLDHRHEGAPGLAHGGAIAAAVDDLLGALLIVLETPAVTASLTVDYRAPVTLGHDLHLEAWADRIDGRKLYLRGEVRDGTQIVAEANAMFLQVDLAHFERSGASLPESWKRWRT